MLARRFAIGCSALALLAVAGFIPAAASPDRAQTICVGLIIDAHAINGPTSAKCVTVKAGTTGVGVLEAGGHTVTFRQDGLLCTIDGLPKTGCSAVDDTHYWAYYHRAPDSTTWSYSNEDSRTYQPVNRSTEGWVYDDGTKLTPKNVPAQQMCAALLKPKPTPTPRPTPRVTPKPTHSPLSAASPHTTTKPKPATTGTGHHSRSRRSVPTPSKNAAPAAAPTSPPSASPPTSTSGESGSGSRGSASGPRSHGNATGVLVAAGVIAILAGATVVGARRRRS